MARDQLKIEQVLQSCLDQIENGQESVESVLARYPDLADQLRPELEVALWLSAQKDLLNPRPGWTAASKRRVLARYQEEIQAESISTGWLGWNPSWIPWFNKRAVQVTFALVLLLALLVGGNGVVMAAQDSLPGDRLYPIKTALEKVNLAISLDETKEAQLQVEYTQRRVDELNRLLVAGRNSDLNEAVENLATQVDQTVDALDSAADQDADQTKEIASDFAAIMRNQNRTLAGLATIADDSTLPVLEKAKDVSESGASAATRQLLQIIPSPTPTTRPRNPRAASDDDEPATKVPTSVPTKTLRPLSTTPPRVTPTPAPIYEPIDEPTATRTPRPAPTATNTPRPLPTNTPVPTNTPRPPTDTPVPTDTPTNTPTNTPVPTNTPTNTPVPTNTPTDTPVPTNTPTPQDTPVPPAVNQSITPTLPATDAVQPGG